MDMLDDRFKRLWQSETAQVEFAGDDPIETRPCFLGAIRDFLTDNRLGVSVKRVFFAGMAALALNGAVMAHVHDEFNVQSQPAGLHFIDKDYIDADLLFKDQKRFDDVFKALAGDLGMEVVSGDIDNIESMQSFADSLYAKGITNSDSLANSIIEKDNGGSPVTMQYFTGVDEAGHTHRVAAITYNGDQNAVLKHVFDGLESEFGTQANQAVELATWTHETMHATIKNSEYNGMVAWKAALGGDFSLYEKWSHSVEAQLAHPDVKSILEKEITAMHRIFDALDHGENIEYDAGHVVQDIRAVQATAGYANYHENMADGFMSMKFMQDGHNIAESIGQSRAKAADRDAVHDTSVGQAAIAKLSGSILEGKNAAELASLTAYTIKTAMGLDATFEVVDNGIDDGVRRLVDTPEQQDQRYPDRDVLRMTNMAHSVLNRGTFHGRSYEKSSVHHGAMTLERVKESRHECVLPSRKTNLTVPVANGSTAHSFNAFREMAMNKLVIRELMEIASVPNGFDEKILLQVQENLAVDVMRIYKQHFMDMIKTQKKTGMSAADAERERREFFAQMLQSEYRNRACNGNGFSLPVYVEAAENFYRLEIGRHLQAVKDYLAQGKVVAETYQIHNAYEIRSFDAGMRDMANRVADGLNAINDSLERLGRVKTQAAKVVTETLRKEMATTISELKGDRFTQALLAEASNLAEAKRHLAALEKEDAPVLSMARP